MKKSLSGKFKVILAVAVLCAGFGAFAGAALAGTANLSWTAPTTNADGSALTDLAGYNVYYDTTSRSGNCPAGYPSANRINAGNNTSYNFTNLPGGHVYYFQVTAVDTSNNESACSTNPGEVSKVITYPGDLDNNRNVNIFDYNVFVSNFGRTNCGNAADIDKNCVVNIFDYNLLIPDFGRSF